MVRAAPAGATAAKKVSQRPVRLYHPHAMGRLSAVAPFCLRPAKDCAGACDEAPGASKGRTGLSSEGQPLLAPFAAQEQEAYRSNLGGLIGGLEPCGWRPRRHRGSRPIANPASITCGRRLPQAVLAIAALEAFARHPCGAAAKPPIVTTGPCSRVQAASRLARSY